MQADPGNPGRPIFSDAAAHAGTQMDRGRLQPSTRHIALQSAAYHIGIVRAAGDGMTEHLSSAEFRKDPERYMDEVARLRKPLAVTREGEQNVVMQSEAECDSWMETLHLLSNPANARDLNDAIAEADVGLYVEGGFSAALQRPRSKCSLTPRGPFRTAGAALTSALICARNVTHLAI
jgi:antitoxin YefM